MKSKTWIITLTAVIGLWGFVFGSLNVVYAEEESPTASADVAHFESIYLAGAGIEP